MGRATSLVVCGGCPASRSRIHFTGRFLINVNGALIKIVSVKTSTAHSLHTPPGLDDLSN